MALPLTNYQLFSHPLLVTLCLDYSISPSSSSPRISLRHDSWKLSSTCSCDLGADKFSEDAINLLSKDRKACQLHIACSSYHDYSHVAAAVEKCTGKFQLDMGPALACLKLCNQFICFCECNSLRAERHKLLKRKVRMPLRENGGPPTGQQWGHVYIVSSNSEKASFKIGFSREHPSKRVSDHRRCFKGAVLVAYTSRISRAHRVEQLVHAELCHQRRREKCAKCKRVHSEWFEISKGDAVEVVKRWAAWICSQPYETQTGKLKRFWEGKLSSTLNLSSQDTGRWNMTWQEWTQSWRKNSEYFLALQHSEKYKLHRCDIED
jgi:T5orf172 domain